jgi:hypothetical protein
VYCSNVTNRVFCFLPYKAVSTHNYGRWESSRVPKREFNGGRMRCRGRCMQVRGAERVQRGWLSLTISTFLRQPFSVIPSESASAREPSVKSHHPYTFQTILHPCTRSVPYLEPSRVCTNHPLDIAAFRSKLQGSELRNMVRAWTSTHT